MKPLRIVLDAGHGGNDPGGESLGRREKDLVLVAQSYLWRDLAARGHSVAPTRVDDTFVPLGDRASFANRLGADLFLSLHCNASGNPGARGPWTIYAAPSTRGMTAATYVQAALATAAGGKASAVYPDESEWVGGRRLAVLRRTAMPAILVELGFMTSPVEIRKLETPFYVASLARAIADGVTAWAGGAA